MDKAIVKKDAKDSKASASSASSSSSSSSSSSTSTTSFGTKLENAGLQFYNGCGVVTKNIAYYGKKVIPYFSWLWVPTVFVIGYAVPPRGTPVDTFRMLAYNEIPAGFPQ
eukprot:TRINITY_DN251_c5_g1_i1.p1 TRINITY_DN251_c5_g1~~TRINITY_DN251_c5_g1_i1.p1  ORF type:complete len:128 (-),score=30.98 TRINITY_DN251_c5_g1_i1:470-799(-)